MPKGDGSNGLAGRPYFLSELSSDSSDSPRFVFKGRVEILRQVYIDIHLGLFGQRIEAATEASNTVATTTVRSKRND